MKSCAHPVEVDNLAELLLQIEPELAPPEEGRRRILSAVEAEWLLTVELRRATRRRRRWLAAAAVVVVSLAAGLLWVRSAVRRPPAATGGEYTVERLFRIDDTRGVGGGLSSGTTLRPGESLTTGALERLALGRPGGPSLRLDTGTTVRLVDAGRLFLSRGRVYVDAAPGQGPASTMRLETPLGEITEIGTQYEALVGDGALRVRVREGAILLHAAAGRFRAAAEDELSLREGGLPERSRIDRYGEPWQWTLSVAPPFDPQGRTLVEFLSWASREAGWELRYVGEDLQRRASSIRVHLPVTGSRPAELLPVVMAACEIDYRLEAGLLLVGEPSAGAP